MSEETVKLLHFVLEDFNEKNVIVLKDFYKKVLQDDPYWHFFWEGKDTFLRVSFSFQSKVERFFTAKGVVTSSPVEWVDNIPITKKYQDVFQKMFHSFSVLCMEIGNDEFWHVLDRVTHCFLNNATTEERRDNFIGTFQNAPLMRGLWETMCLHTVASQRALIMGSLYFKTK